MFKFRRTLRHSVVFQLHQLSCLRVTSYSLYLDNFGLCQKCVNESFIELSIDASLMDWKIIHVIATLSPRILAMHGAFLLKKCRQRYGFLLLCGLKGK